MKIYLIRHGIAVPRSQYEEDKIRPLTPEGKLKVAKVAERLGQLKIRFNLLLTSPLVRAKQTAAILSHLADQVKDTDFLAPEGKLIDWLKNFSYDEKLETLALVGHQPDLGNWAEQLVWGSIQDKLILKKAGIIGIEIPMTENCMGKGELFLLVSPKWILI